MTARTASGLGFDAPAYSLLQAFRKIARVRRRRRDLAELRGLDDHMLRDIGLSRSDLRSAVFGDRRRSL